MTENPDFCIAGAAEPLLKKLFYENCPGCKVDQINATRRGMPIKEFLFIWIVVLCNALPISSLFPFLYFMVCILLMEASLAINFGFF